jgi:hypothetical protein
VSDRNPYIGSTWIPDLKLEKTTASRPTHYTSKYDFASRPRTQSVLTCSSEDNPDVGFNGGGGGGGGVGWLQ